jgi:uncharacterized protein YkwD
MVSPITRYLIPVLFVSLSLAKDPPKSSSNPERVSAASIIYEINLARQNPALYASFIEAMRGMYSGNIRVSSTGTVLKTHEGLRALNEAIRFLHNAQPQPTLALSPGLCQAAADHCRDQAAGSMGHNGSDRSSPGARISRYGAWQGGWAENIAYGHSNAREIVLALIIDDGVRGRGHRKNIFNAMYNVAGAAYGPHARFGSVCDIDFAGAYAETALVSAN